MARREISPLQPGEEVEVGGMASEDECGREIFVSVRRSGGSVAVLLAQLEAVDADAQTRQAVEDWRYWVGQGYRF